MIKNFIAEIVHVTKRLKAKDVEVEDRLATTDLNSETVNIEKDLTVGNDTVIKKNLTVNGNKTVDGNITLGGSVSNKTGTIPFKGNVTVEKNLTVGNDTVIKKDLTVNGNETVDGNITLGGSVSNKTGTIPFKGNVTVEKNLTVGGNETIEKDLHVKGSEIIDKDLTVKGKTTMTELTVEKIVDNGKVYGETSEINELTWDSASNKNAEGSIEKPARIDHKHKIPVPKTLTIKSSDEKSSVSYNAQSDQTLKINSDFTGSAVKNHSSSTTDYGVGTSSVYGHLKLRDELSSAKDYDNLQGTAATPKMVNNLANLIADTYAKKTECYGVETFVTPKSGSKFLKWYPSRTGIYRIYLIGGGGFSSPGMAVATSGDPSTYEGGIGLGTAMAGYGGSGGDVTVIDLKIREVNVGGSSEDSSEDETTGDGGEIEESADRVATIKFLRERAISGYNATTGAYSYASNDSGAVTYVRSVAISGLKTIGEILNPQPTSSIEKYSSYDAIAAHGADAVRYKKADGTWACGLFKSSDYTAPTCGGSANYSGGAGNSTKPTSPDQSSTLNNSSKRLDGYNGGYPGSANVHGSVGELGSPGALVNYTTYTAKSVKGIIKVKGGTGGCLSLQDLSNYHGSFKDFDATAASFGFPKTTPSNGGGYGYYGGGHGGGGATIITNSAFTGSSAKYMNIWQRNGSNSPCVIIAYLGRG